EVGGAGGDEADVAGRARGVRPVPAGGGGDQSAAGPAVGDQLRTALLAEAADGGAMTCAHARDAGLAGGLEENRGDAGHVRSRLGSGQDHLGDAAAAVAVEVEGGPVLQAGDP